MIYVFAALGGALGALARWAIAEALPHSPGAWPWSTLLVNLVGCLALGGLLAVLLARYPHSPWLRPFLAVGVLGGFTTFSAFSLETVMMIQRGQGMLAIGYVLASVLGALGALALGLLFVRSVA